ncbi:GntR family transcriptional regulator [Rhodococcus sp. 14-2470-1b]|jgi:DNA-binding FadR family transcriptional regulator|uniref:FadR/GntR family transcriptional regulator n=1 Tax=unclassified Rhodococcus (in: high G+C Gram-positive bacteria) TaxID=192944 RepID=UPI000B9A9974|nr:FadR/GntR family transcriptional regulator [Rhodococcus sp. 14-2470-1b]OZF50900.1 GntR family transcriptional regulator [Rhodococcus sp. 14-2470-1b]
MNLSDSWAVSQPTATRLSAAEAVFADIRDAIVAGQIAIGERLPAESALATRYAVSRSVIREALRSCNALGLTETKTGRGTFVTRDRVTGDLDIGNYDARELMEARPHVEIPSAGWAAERRTDEDLAVLEGLTDEMRGEDDHQAWVLLDGQFHTAIARASKNRVFEAIIVDIRGALTRQSETLNLVARRQQKSNTEHDLIVEGIRSGSYEKAAEAMAAHLDAVRGAVESLRR